MANVSSAVVYLYDNRAAVSGTALPKTRKKDHVLLMKPVGPSGWRMVSSHLTMISIVLLSIAQPTSETFAKLSSFPLLLCQTHLSFSNATPLHPPPHLPWNLCLWNTEYWNVKCYETELKLPWNWRRFPLTIKKEKKEKKNRGRQMAWDARDYNIYTHASHKSVMWLQQYTKSVTCHSSDFSSTQDNHVSAAVHKNSHMTVTWLQQWTNQSHDSDMTAGVQ